MARSPITKTTPLGSYPSLPLAADSADLSFQAATGSSGSSGNYIAFGDYGNLCVLAWNTHATNPYTVTFTSLASSAVFNRTGDISGYSLAAGDIAVFQFQRNGWFQSDGNLYLEANNAAVKFAAFGY